MPAVFSFYVQILHFPLAAESLGFVPGDIADNHFII
jgi:hypothetical protein